MATLPFISTGQAAASPTDQTHAIQYKLLLVPITILIIDLDKLSLFYMSFYALYQLGLEIHYELSYKCVESFISWQEWTTMLTHHEAKFIMH